MSTDFILGDPGLTAVTCILLVIILAAIMAWYGTDDDPERPRKR